MDASGFELLHPRVKQLVIELGWSGLYPIQEAAIECFATDDSDFIVAAPTAAGKTESLALPILSNLVGKPAKSVQVLCISPLKSLINDQWTRMTKLCRTLGIEVSRWHGDVPQDHKRRLRQRPRGIAFLTPESLESCFINYPHEILKLFRCLQYVIIDELHSMLDTERGIHVKSLMARLTTTIQHRPRFFGLSATLGDPLAARSFLNLDHPESVHLLIDKSTARPLQVEVVAITGDELPGVTPSESDPEEPQGCAKASGLARIAEDLRGFCRDGTSLVFANSRRTVEELADHFLEQCEFAIDGEAAVVLHHGSLSARVRRQTESLLKSGLPARAVATSSLELGIDIGAIEGIAQIDAPSSVCSLIQRLGRSGRRPGSTRHLRLYVRLAPSKERATLTDLLHPQLLQAVAMVRLLMKGWLEPVKGDRMNLSTLIHQTFSVLKETGGRTCLNLYHSLCQEGPFRQVTPEDFKLLLQGLHRHDLIQQDAEGVLFLGTAGEKITSLPGFYAAFVTPVELTVRCGAKELGRLPATALLKEGQCLLLNGRRWIVDSIAWKSKSIWVTPTERKQAPVFLGNSGEIHDRVFQEMRDVLSGDDEPEWLDATSLQFLQSARETARTAGLLDSNLLDLENAVQWFPWCGTRTMRTLDLWAQHEGLDCATDQLSLTFEGVSREELERHLRRLADEEPNAVKLAALLRNKQVERFDQYIDELLLDKANSKYRIDVASAAAAARRTLNKPRSGPADPWRRR